MVFHSPLMTRHSGEGILCPALCQLLMGVGQVPEHKNLVGQVLEHKILVCKQLSLERETDL